ncbi:MAG: hypothetical protein IKM43_03755 [Clostridia bacterium]|nr:hypothetical protein [Clostridia bacterium]
MKPIKFNLSSIKLYLYTKDHKVYFVTDCGDDTDFKPFICFPEVSPSSKEEKIARNLFPTNSLYYILANGGQQLKPGQREFFNVLSDKYIKIDKDGNFLNEETATITLKQIQYIEREFNRLADRREVYINPRNKSELTR